MSTTVSFRLNISYSLAELIGQVRKACVLQLQSVSETGTHSVDMTVDTWDYNKGGFSIFLSSSSSSSPDDFVAWTDTLAPIVYIGTEKMK
jgi:hypothetical protein